MKTYAISFGWVVAVAAAFSLAGCNNQPAGETGDVGDTPPDTVAADGGHDDHEGHGHDHSAAGPHGGDLVELGEEEYHAEVVHEGGGVTVYMLDGSAKNASPVDAAEVMINLVHDGKPEQFVLQASPDSGDPQGKASRFVSDDAELAQDLDAGVEARLMVNVGGTPYNGQISHDHGHDHGDDGHAGHGHGHAGDDALVWRQEGIQEGDYTITLGHHGTELHAGEPVEPAVMITSGGKDVADARVFSSILIGDKTVADEKPTVFEPKTAEEPAHYAQGTLLVPPGAEQVTLRYRIVLPDGEQKSFDVSVDAK